MNNDDITTMSIPSVVDATVGTAATAGTPQGTPPTTPPSSPWLAAVCPAAPKRVPRLLIPQISDHEGLGILTATAMQAGDFIKPDPLLTRQETRRYVVAELERWLTGRICVHAKEVAVAHDGEPELVAPLVAVGRWPAARLWLVLEGLKGVAEQVGLPADYDEQFHWVGRWAARVCVDHLRGIEAVAPAAQMAVGFVTTDRLPGGRTIDSFWNHSPFAALRSAAPLSDRPPAVVAALVPEESDVEESDSESESEEAAEEAAEAAAIGPVGVDAFLDQMTIDAWKIMHLRVEMPLWVPTAFLGAFIAYIWVLVLVFVSGRR